ncbi:HET-domain-containing protein, partial [Cadophora sp. DSE1049]
MRLLNIKTFQLETFFSDVPEYAALSHMWGDEEVTFQDLTVDFGRKKKGWNKILGSTIQAAKHGCDYVWIDTCCIDKTSSAELSEAINSMFRWYRKSKVCFAYLEDATPPPSPRPAICFLPNSRWFKRGWTLQELVAPTTVHFYDSSWNEIGEKRQLEKEIFEITGIDSDVLHNHKALYTKSIARRMSWASRRETTRTEDIAYCLMGVFDINMPLLYGEGERAFIRLQEAIIQSNYDHSLFAWNHHFPNTLFGTMVERNDAPLLGVGLLAPHPVAFKKSANIIPHTMRAEPYTITNRGLRIHLRL